MDSLSAAEQFFYDHAGFSVRVSEGETTEDGRLRTARELAAAEQWARDQMAVIEWEDDDVAHLYYDRASDRDTHYYGCIVIVGNVTESLWGIDLIDWDDPYKRVVVAELASQVMYVVTERAELDAYMDGCYG